MCDLNTVKSFDIMDSIKFVSKVKQNLHYKTFHDYSHKNLKVKEVRGNY